LPATSVALIESNSRKCEFIARAITAAGIGNARAVNERAETWIAGRGASDVVTARALAAPAVVAEYAAPLLRLGGTLVAWTGRREPELEVQTGRAASILGLSESRIVPVLPFPGARNRNLTVMSKLSDTPSRFPRRPGLARKRPLGATAASI
jgi:16S rRNA (guanine527-N7)-methyltransferase